MEVTVKAQEVRYYKITVDIEDAVEELIALDYSEEEIERMSPEEIAATVAYDMVFQEFADDYCVDTSIEIY